MNNTINESDKLWWENIQVISDTYPKQKEVFFDKTQFKVVSAGSGAGKTVLAMEWAIMKSLSLMNKKGICWFVAPTTELVRDIYWNDVLSRIKFLDRMNAKRGKAPVLISSNVRARRIYVRNRGGGVTEIALKSAEADKSLIGQTVHVMVIDEMWKTPIDIWRRHLSQRAKRGNADVLIISTPNGHDHFWELWELGNMSSPKKLPNWKSFRLCTYDNPMYPQEYIEQEKRTLSSWEFAQQYEGSFDTPQGRAYNSFDDTLNIKHGLTLDVNRPIYMTWDFNVSPMTTSICQIHHGDLEYQKLIEQKYAIIKQIRDKSISSDKKSELQLQLTQLSKMIKDYPVKEQKEVLYVLKTFYVNETDSEKQCVLIKQWLNEQAFNNVIYMYGDATGGSRTSTSYRTNWGNIDYAFQNYSLYNEYGRSNPDPLERVRIVNAKLKNADNEIGVYIDYDNCKELIADLQQVRRKKGSNDIDKGKMEAIGRNHAIEGLGYLIAKRLKVEKREAKPAFAFI